MIKYSFADNTVYDTEDVNNITANIIGAGVASFPAKDTYSAEDLNGLTSALISSGVNLNGCKCTYSAENGTVTVAPGIVYFANGIVLTVDSENGAAGHFVTVPAKTAGYVYAIYNTASQIADVVFEQTLPDSGTVVALCELTADGAVRDRRVFARSKVATFGTNAAAEAVLEWNKYETESGTTVLARVTSDISKFNYAVVKYKAGTSSQRTGLFNLATGVFDLSPMAADGDTNYFYGESYSLRYNVEMVDGILCVTSPSGIAQQQYVTMTLI